MTADAVPASNWRTRLWPRTKPGHVRISSRKLIDLLQQALRAVQLEAEIAQHERARAAHVRRVDASDLLARQQAAAGIHLDAHEVDVLTRDLPQRESGELHETAFLAQVGNALLERRLFANVPTTGGTE